MVWRDTDPITGADRDALFVSAADARRLGVAEGDAVVVRSAVGEVRARVTLARLRDGNVQMFFPEANPLLDPARRDPVGLVPDYNAEVAIAPVAP
jgi:anaerobic selenocysteine-containing dehydrogenase